MQAQHAVAPELDHVNLVNLFVSCILLLCNRMHQLHAADCHLIDLFFVICYWLC